MSSPYPKPRAHPLSPALVISRKSSFSSISIDWSISLFISPSLVFCVASTGLTHMVIATAIRLWRRQEACHKNIQCVSFEEKYSKQPQLIPPPMCLPPRECIALEIKSVDIGAFLTSLFNYALPIVYRHVQSWLWEAREMRRFKRS